MSSERPCARNCLVDEFNLVSSFVIRAITSLVLSGKFSLQNQAIVLKCGPVIEIAEVGGLHHRYERRAACHIEFCIVKTSRVTA